jgi:hypothetical protein
MSWFLSFSIFVPLHAMYYIGASLNAYAYWY